MAAEGTEPPNSAVDRSEILLQHTLDGEVIGVVTAGDFLDIADAWEREEAARERQGRDGATRCRELACAIRTAIAARDLGFLGWVADEEMLVSRDVEWVDEDLAESINRGAVALQTRPVLRRRQVGDAVPRCAPRARTPRGRTRPRARRARRARSPGRSSDDPDLADLPDLPAAVRGRR
jgi:hypothetical protein